MRVTSIRRTFGSAAVAAVILVGTMFGTATAAFTTTEMASIGPGGEPPDAHAFVQDISADGSVVFLSSSAVFAGGGTGWMRVYLRSGSTTTAITPTPGYSVERAGISENGRFIVYTLGNGPAPAVYLYDTQDQTTSFVVTVGSSYPEFVQNSQLDVSDDGRYVLFDTITGLDVADSNSVKDVYRYDRQLAGLEWVSRNPDTTPSDGESIEPHMTPDGSAIAFTSLATNLVADDTNATRDAFLWTPTSLTRVSTDALGTELTTPVGRRADITDDGRYVVFDSYDPLLSPLTWFNSVILKDSTTGSVEMVSHDDSKRDDINARNATISGDGTVVAYESDWPWINYRPQGNHYDAVVKDRVAGTIELLNSTGPTRDIEGNAQASNPIVNADGTIAAFDSFATDLVASPAVPPFTNQVYRVTRSARHAQTLTFANPGGKTLAQSPLTLSGTTSSGLAVTYTSLTPLVCQEGGPNGLPIYLVATGTCRITASQPGNQAYTAATSVTRAFNVNKANQSISFASPGTKTMLQTPVTVVGTASSGLPVTFSGSTPLVCTVSDTTVTLVAAGSCSITATQAGNAVYNAANAITRTFTVNKVAQAITFTALSNQPITAPPLTVSATANSGLPVTFSTSTPLICTAAGTNGETITLIAAGTCTVSANQAGDDVYRPANTVNRNFTVTKLSQTITFANPGAKTLALTPQVTVSATSGSTLTVTFTTTTPLVCTAGGANGEIITLLALGTCSVRADQAGDAIWKPANGVTRNFAVR